MGECTDMKRVHRDYVALVKDLESTFDGQVILGNDALDTEILTLEFTIRPNAGIYVDCEVRFKAKLDGYPEQAPQVMPITRVLHPNISCDCYDEDVCVNVIDEWEEFQDEYRGLQILIQGILFLFYEPNVNDALTVDGAFPNLEELMVAVNHVKYGSAMWDNIYRGAEKPVREINSNSEKTDKVEDKDCTEDSRSSLVTDSPGIGEDCQEKLEIPDQSGEVMEDDTLSSAACDDCDGMKVETFSNAQNIENTEDGDENRGCEKQTILLADQHQELPDPKLPLTTALTARHKLANADMPGGSFKRS